MSPANISIKIGQLKVTLDEGWIGLAPELLKCIYRLVAEAEPGFEPRDSCPSRRVVESRSPFSLSFSGMRCRLDILGDHGNHFQGELSSWFHFLIAAFTLPITFTYSFSLLGYRGPRFVIVLVWKLGVGNGHYFKFTF